MRSGRPRHLGRDPPRLIRLAPELLLPSLTFSVGILPAFRVLMVWVYERTGSLLVAMLMHASLTAGNLLLVPRKVVGVPGSVWSFGFAVAAWIAVAAVVKYEGLPLWRPPLHLRAARAVWRGRLRSPRPGA